MPWQGPKDLNATIYLAWDGEALCVGAEVTDDRHVNTQTLGNIVAIVTQDIKRMLAYSGIAHMGYAMVGIIVAGEDGGAAVLVYLAAYTVMNMGAFAAVALMSECEDEPHLISTLAGQGWTRAVVYSTDELYEAVRGHLEKAECLLIGSDERNLR